MKKITLRHLGKLKKKFFFGNWYIWLATLYQESVPSQPTLEDRVPPDRVSALMAFLCVMHPERRASQPVIRKLLMRLGDPATETGENSRSGDWMK